MLDPQPEARLDATSRAVAAAAVLLGLYLYLGRLGGTPVQRGNEAMYMFPPIQMLESGDYLVSRYQGEHFLDKPSLTHWIVAASYRVLGVSVFAARLPSAIAGLATVLILGLWVRRRSGGRCGLLAALILMFSFEFVFLGMTFAGDAFLTLGVLVAVLALERASVREDGSDAAWGALCGSALALAFYFKGLVGIVLPVGAVAAALLLDRRKPVRLPRRAAWTLACLIALLAPWHWAMAHRLGEEFWRVFYWENQFLRGATLRFMKASRSPLLYAGVLLWAIFPWSLLLPATLRRRRPSSLPLAWLLFGLIFWSLLAMKREVYLLPLLPAAAALVAEGSAGQSRFESAWRRLAWGLAAVDAAAALILWVRGFHALTAVAGPGAAVFLGVALVVFLTALFAAALSPRDSRALFSAALACGVVCLALRVLDERIARFDPLPDWGERVRRDCAAGCDGFLYGLKANSLDFYSRLDWAWLDDPAHQLAGRMRHRKAFLVMPTRLEPQLAALPVTWEVIERRASFGSYGVDMLGENWPDALQSLSLVRIEPPRRREGAGEVTFGPS
ncbi:MAG: ArnT family glycosyltransferase [Thermoanaerobaculia bacterium]